MINIINQKNLLPTWIVKGNKKTTQDQILKIVMQLIIFNIKCFKVSKGSNPHS
jgi:hypothetical protein